LPTQSLGPENWRGYLRKDFSHAGNDDVNKNKNHFVTVEEQLESIGVGVIWFERFEEVPQMIRQIISPLRFYSPQN
jgi:hypothetical protein